MLRSTLRWFNHIRMWFLFTNDVKRVPKARKWLRNTMSPWTLQWGPRSFMGGRLLWVTSALQNWACTPDLSRCDLFFHLFYLSLLPLWFPVGGEKEHDQNKEREARKSIKNVQDGHEEKQVEGRGSTPSWGTNERKRGSHAWEGKGGGREEHTRERFYRRKVEGGELDSIWQLW